MEMKTATVEDLPALVNMAREFVAESAHGWRFDPHIAMQTFNARIGYDQSDVLCVIERGELAAAAMVIWHRDFVVEPLGFVEKFFVLPAHRGTKASRLLVGACVAWFEDHGVKAAFCTATANLSAAHDKQFINLFGKFGFKPCGDTVIREFDRG